MNFLLVVFCLLAMAIYLYGVRDQFVPWLKSVRQITSLITALAWVDRLGNVLAGGHWHSTISARVGFFSNPIDAYFWRFVETVIDWAFRPIDGKEHCKKAMLSNTEQDFHHGGTFRLFILSILVCVFVPIIGIVIRVYLKLVN